MTTLAFTNTDEIQELQQHLQKKIRQRDSEQKHYAWELGSKCFSDNAPYTKFKIEQLQNEIAVITEKLNELRQTNKIIETEVTYHRCNSLYDKDFD